MSLAVDALGESPVHMTYFANTLSEDPSVVRRALCELYGMGEAFPWDACDPALSGAAATRLRH